MDDRPSVFSAFTGVGGFDLGLERAGFRIAAQCEGGGDPNGTKTERDQWASGAWRRRVLAERFPGVPCLPDIRDVARGRELRDGARMGQRDIGPGSGAGESAGVPSGRVDLACGGFPCQDVSVAGGRAGLAGERSGLFYEFARVADEFVRPGGWVFLENVPGLLSSNSGRDFAVILATLADIGFLDGCWRVLDSRHFGVPQRRRRVFILARRATGERARAVLFDRESGQRTPTTRRETGAGVAFASLSGVGSGGPDDNDGQAGRVIVANTVSRHDGRVSQREHQTTLVPAVEHGVRRLTPVECERLQGFPDGWTGIQGAPDSRRYAALGDAVTVPVIEWIGRRLRREFAPV